MYGKPLPPQNGGPIRLTLPWKYGFKSAKALVKISFTEKRPVNFWQAIQPSEYGFWANVNPAVAHPRWSQARERLLGSNEMVPTQIYNGYGEFVASLVYRPEEREAVHVIAQRILAVLAAVLLVGAVALAMLGPPDGAARPGAVHGRPRPDGRPAQRHRAAPVAPGCGTIWCMPLLVRPAWLVPAALGLICAGMSLTLSTRKTTHRSHRRS